MGLKIACIQLTSGADIAANIARIEVLVKSAAAQGAKFVAFPENAFYMRAEGQAAPPKYTLATHPGAKAASAMAKQHGLWLLAGSIATIPSLRNDKKSYNRSLLFNPQGKIAAQYDKIHLFDYGALRESNSVEAGKQIIPPVNTVVGRVGLSICFDVRTEF